MSMNQQAGVVIDQLGSRMNLGEVTSWRLHWLICDLEKLQQEAEGSKYGVSSTELITGKFAEHLKVAQEITGKYSRLWWETKTMLGLRYTDEVAPLFVGMPKHDEYLQAVDKLKTFFERTAQRILDGEKMLVTGKIAALSHVGMVV